MRSCDVSMRWKVPEVPVDPDHSLITLARFHQSRQEQRQHDDEEEEECETQLRFSSGRIRTQASIRSGS